jgi:hypothetical protein
LYLPIIISVTINNMTVMPAINNVKVTEGQSASRKSLLRDHAAALVLAAARLFRERAIAGQLWTNISSGSSGGPASR